MAFGPRKFDVHGNQHKACGISHQNHTLNHRISSEVEVRLDASNKCNLPRLAHLSIALPKP